MFPVGLIPRSLRCASTFFFFSRLHSNPASIFVSGLVFVLSLLSSIFLSSVVAAPLSSSSAVQLDLVGKRRPLHKRDEFGVFGNGSLGLRNNRDIDYRCNVTLGGRAYQVEIDSGRLAS